MSTTVASQSWVRHLQTTVRDLVTELFNLLGTGDVASVAKKIALVNEQREYEQNRFCLTLLAACF